MEIPSNAATRYIIFYIYYINISQTVLKMMLIKKSPSQQKSCTINMINYSHWTCHCNEIWRSCWIDGKNLYGIMCSTWKSSLSTKHKKCSILRPFYHYVGSIVGCFHQILKLFLVNYILFVIQQSIIICVLNTWM